MRIKVTHALFHCAQRSIEFNELVRGERYSTATAGLGTALHNDLNESISEPRTGSGVNAWQHRFPLYIDVQQLEWLADGEYTVQLPQPTSHDMSMQSG